MGESRLSFYGDRPVRCKERDIKADAHFALAIDYIESHMDPSSPCRLLDIGFAQPEFLEYMVRNHPNLTGYGCDISTPRVAAAARDDRIEFKLVDFNECKGTYQESSFDFIFAGEIIEHLENTDNLITESLEYLKSGGYFIITTPNLAAWFERLLLLFGMEPFMAEVSYSSRLFGKRPLYRLFRQEGSPPIGHLRLFTPAALRDLCVYHGLVPVRHEGYYTYGFFLNRWLSRLSANLAQGIFMVFRKP
jgi:SAM-dependent methyltransferase